MTNKPKKEPWRIVVASIAVICIIFLWVKKDPVSVYAELPVEAMLPIAVTSVGVTLLKAAVFAGAILLIRWFFRKFQKK